MATLTKLVLAGGAASVILVAVSAQAQQQPPDAVSAVEEAEVPAETASQPEAEDEDTSMFQELEEAIRRVSIRGFGGWGYGITNNNHYLIGRPTGEYNHVRMALSITATPYESVSVTAQPQWIVGEDGLVMQLDYAFAEWRVSDLFNLKAGQIKQPFGIYTEVFDVGTVRPFFELPQSIYGPSEIVSRSYRGLGVSGAVFSEGGWGVEYDLYGGFLVVASDSPFGFFEQEAAEAATGTTGQHTVDADAEHAGSHDVKNFAGARATVSTPLEGLQFGVSGYGGQGTDETGAHGEQKEAHWAIGAHAEYLAHGLSLRAEYAHQEHFDKQNAFYVEAAYLFLEHWQLAAHYDWSQAQPHEVDTSEAPSLTRHGDLGAAFNYWVNPQWVFRLEYHWVDGNRFAHPATAAAVHKQIKAGTLSTKTQLLIFGTHFSF